MVKMFKGLTAIILASLPLSINAESDYLWTDNSPGVYSDGNGGFVVVSEIKNTNVVDNDQLLITAVDSFKNYADNAFVNKMCWHPSVVNTAVVEYGVDGNYEVKTMGCTRFMDFLLNAPSCDKEVGFILNNKIKKE